MIRMHIKTIVVGNGGPEGSLVVLHTADDSTQSIQLPIQIGFFEAAAISACAEGTEHSRPLTHDLLQASISALGGTVSSVRIVDVEGTTFYAQVELLKEDGEAVMVDARPSDALALALRTHSPIFVDEDVLGTATLPDFAAVEREEEQNELERFHDFVEGLSPEDFDFPGDGPAEGQA